MKIILEGLSKDSEDEILYDSSKTYGMLVIVLDDETRIRINQEDNVKGDVFLHLNLYAKYASDVIIIIPRASNSVWVGHEAS